MKYVRTNYGKIFDTTKMSIPPRASKGTTIIASADTIEELCDCFISITENGRINICTAFEPFKNAKGIIFCGKEEKIIEKYGAIHVKNKGLIYVIRYVF